jgi:hypothetical protein
VSSQPPSAGGHEYESRTIDDTWGNGCHPRSRVGAFGNAAALRLGVHDEDVIDEVARPS